MTTTKLDSLNLPADLVTRLRTEVLYDDATLEAASFADIRDLPAGLRIILRKAFPNLAEKPAASDAGSHAPAGRVNPLLAGITDRSDAIKAIVSKIAEGDRSPDMLSAARSLSISSVARLDGAVSVSATLSYLAHLAEGGSVRPSWKDHEIVDLAELVKKLRISPTNSGELEDGVDPRTGIDWSSKPDEMVARIRFAAQDGMLVGMSDTAIVAAYEGGDPHLVDRTKRRMKAAKADVESLLRQLRGERTIDRSVREVAQGIRDPHYGIGNGSATANLQGLVLSLFSASELRTFVRYGEDGERLEGGLPGVNASAADIAFAVATAWHKHRHVGRSLMERMIADHPRRASDIRRVFEQFGVH